MTTYKRFSAAIQLNRAILAGCVLSLVGSIGCNLAPTPTDPCATATIDDGDACTTDTCVDSNGVADVTHTPIACSNGLMCVAGECVECVLNDDCVGDQVCSNGVCEDAPVVAECTTNGDCDDGLYCTGTETCNTNGECVDGENPCAATQVCDEETETCEDVTPDPLVLTSSADTLTGGDLDDEFDGALNLTSEGVLEQTLNDSDKLDGGAGVDTLSAQLMPSATTTTTPESLANIEVFHFEVTTGNHQTINMANAGSERTIEFADSAADHGDLTLTNLAVAPTEFGIYNCTESLSVTIDDAALAGSDDSFDLILDGVILTGTEPIVTIQPKTSGQSGYETINIVSQGNTANSLQQLTDGNGNSLTTINVTGDQDLDMNATTVDTTVTTVNASQLAGGLHISIPGDGTAGTTITVKGGSGNDDLNCTDTADEVFAVTAGAGDDRVTFGANLDSATRSTDTVDGGEGTDTLVIVSADAVATVVQTNVSNFEALEVSNALAGDFDPVSYWGSGITNIKLTGGISGTAHTIVLPSGGTLSIDADVSAAVHEFQVGGTGITDSLLLDLAHGVDFGAEVKLSGIEELTIEGPSTGGTKIAFAGALTMAASAGGATKITITGDTEVEFVGTVTVGTLDASSATGTIDIQTGTASASSITGGLGADTLMGSNSNDVISGGGGNDIIDGNDGEDSLTGGDGSDTFRWAAGDQSAAPSGAVYSVITDFQAGSDVLDDTAAALSIASGSVGFGVATASISSEGICSFNAADDTLDERVIAAESGIAANGVAAAGQFCFFTHDGNTYFFVSDGTDGVDANDVMLQFAGVATLSDSTITGGNVTIQ